MPAISIWLTRSLLSATARSIKHLHFVRSRLSITHSRIPVIWIPRATATILASMGLSGMFDTSSSVKARAAPLNPNLLTALPESWPASLWISFFASRMARAIRASASQLCFLRECDRRFHVAGALSVIRWATAACQPPDSESAQNMAACLTRSFSWVWRGGGGAGCCQREGAGAGGCEATVSHAERLGAGLVLEGGLRRAEAVARDLAVLRFPLVGAPGPPCQRQRSSGLLTGFLHGVPSSVRAPQSAIPGVSARPMGHARAVSPGWRTRPRRAPARGGVAAGCFLALSMHPAIITATLKR